MSPSTRGCGLKYWGLHGATTYRLVTLYTRVWIEINAMPSPRPDIGVTLYTRVWIEICRCIATHNLAYVTLYTRVWIEISGRRTDNLFRLRHPLHEGVDWNRDLGYRRSGGIGHPLHERVWIEIFIAAVGFFGRAVTLHVRVWIEIERGLELQEKCVRSPFAWGCGLNLRLVRMFLTILCGWYGAASVSSPGGERKYL